MQKAVIIPITFLFFAWVPKSCQVMATVGNVHITGVTSSTFAVNYDAVTSATSYEIRWYSANEPPFTTSITTTSLQVSGVSPIENEYFVQVAYSDGSGQSAFSSNVSTRIWSIANVTQTSVGLTWSEYTPAIGYYLQLSNTVNDTAPTLYTFTGSSTSSAVISDLYAGTTYSISLQAFIVDASDPGSIILIPLFIVPQTTVWSIRVDSVTDSSFQVVFDAIIWASSYDVVWYSGTQTATVTSTDTTVQITGVTPLANEYTVQVAYVVNATVRSHFFTNITTKLWDISSVTQTTMALNWTDYTSATGYLLRFANAATGVVSQELDFADASVTSATASGLEPGTSYNISLQARTVESGVTSLILLFDIPQLTFLDTVQNVRVVGVTTSGFNVTFDRFDPFPYSSTSQTVYEVRRYNGSDVSTFNTTATNVQLTGLSPVDNQYFVQVGYVVDAFQSAFSANTSTALWQITDVMDTNVSLSWTTFSVATGYFLQVKHSTTGVTRFQYNSSDTSTTYLLVVGLESGTTYSILMSAWVAGGGLISLFNVPQTTLFCTQGTCLNSGNCTELSAGFQCECPIGYSGTQCGTAPLTLLTASTEHTAKGSEIGLTIGFIISSYLCCILR